MGCPRIVYTNLSRLWLLACFDPTGEFSTVMGLLNGRLLQLLKRGLARVGARLTVEPPHHPSHRAAGDGSPVHRSRTSPDCPGVLSRADRLSRHPAGLRPASALAGRVAALSPGGTAGVPSDPASYPATRPSLRTPHAGPAVGHGVGSRAFAAPVSRLRRVANRGTGPLALH
jgi:hypothetical protein